MKWGNLKDKLSNRNSATKRDKIASTYINAISSNESNSMILPF